MGFGFMAAGVLCLRRGSGMMEQFKINLYLGGSVGLPNGSSLSRYIPREHNKATI
jgi:hypothetical protein